MARRECLIQALSPHEESPWFLPGAFPCPPQKKNNMDINTYSALAMRTAGTKDPLVDGLLGLSGETGEVADYMKKVLFHDKEFNRDTEAEDSAVRGALK